MGRKTANRPSKSVNLKARSLRSARNLSSGDDAKPRVSFSSSSLNNNELEEGFEYDSELDLSGTSRATSYSVISIDEVEGEPVGHHALPAFVAEPVEIDGVRQNQPETVEIKSRQHLPADVADPKANGVPDDIGDDEVAQTTATPPTALSFEMTSQISDDGLYAMPESAAESAESVAHSKPSAFKYLANIYEDSDTSDDDDDVEHSRRNKKRFFYQWRLHQQMMMASEWRRSTGSLGSSHLDQSSLSLMIRSLLDPCLHLYEADMLWRKELLENRHMEYDLMEGIRFLNRTDGIFINSLQEKRMDISPSILKKGERQMLPKSDSSTSSTRSLFSSFSFLSNKSSDARGGIKFGSVRRFLDLTSCQDADDGGVVYEPPPAYDANDDDDDMSISSSYSIQVRTPKVEMGGRSKYSRYFLDLTLDQSVYKSSRRLSLVRRSSLLPPTHEEDDEKDVVEPNADEGSALDAGALVNDEDNAASGRTKSPSHGGGSEDDDRSVDSDQDDVFNSEGWERADAAFIESVHDVARLLERNLVIQGHESPFWCFNEIVSRFDIVHSKIRENYDRCIAEEKEQIQTVSMDGSGRGKNMNPLRQVKNAMKRLGTDKRQTASMESMVSAKHTTGYDDLEDGQWRDEEAFTQNFMYSMRKDNSVSLPAVLAKGLDKRLSDTTNSKAVDIIEDLTSPLFSHRKSSYDELHQVRPVVTSSMPKAEEPASPQKASFFGSFFGTPTQQSGSHENDAVNVLLIGTPTLYENDAPDSIQVGNRDREDTKTAPVERLTLLERTNSHSSLMTTESTDKRDWFKAGTFPALANEDQGGLFQSVVVGKFADQFVNY